MGDGQKVTLFVNEEGVAKETVVVTARGWGLVELINDGADSGDEREASSARSSGGAPAVRQPRRQTTSANSQEALLPLFWRVRGIQRPFWDTVKKVAARREAGKARKRTGREGLTGSGNDCIFCNNRNN